ncbi:MAG: YggS family pyridoxal phosphate-dependent enzyme [Coriobacteriia bacterium]|nr:YggS family pyridoxal phosphate-dependent enzyme [Coriobacteriia bacterium]MCL2537673.1 YggS family pyridoxal phosphate-dependent enzyme [Coriobacteriia bacterium]
MSTLVENFEAVRARIADAARRSSRDSSEVELIAVSKTETVDTVLRARELCGQQHFGENRADELQRKVSACLDAGTPLDFHFIGPLQTNKVRKVVGATSLIHSVDSQRLLRAIDARAKLAGIIQPVLIQVSISGEEAKQGIEPAELDALLQLVNEDLENIQVNGLMTMAPFIAAEQVRWIFEALRELRDRTDGDGPQVALRELSMGMTGDFEVAIEEGATLVRIGTALFAG